MTLACPFCGVENDGHDGLIPSERPIDGDVSLCWRCGCFGMYAKSTTEIRQPTEAELSEIGANRQAQSALAVRNAEFINPERAVEHWRTTLTDQERQ